MKILSLLTVTACLIGSAKPSPAQQPWPISLEAVIGGTVGRSDNESAFCGDRAGPFFDILASGRLHPADRGGLVVALNATGHFINTYQIGCGFEEPSQENLDYFPGQGGFFWVGRMGESIHEAARGHWTWSCWLSGHVCMDRPRGRCYAARTTPLGHRDAERHDGSELGG